MEATVFFDDDAFGILTEVEINVSNIETQFQYFPFVFNVNASATSTYGTTTVLSVGQHYAIVSFKDAAGERYKSKGFQFTVVSSQYSEDIPPFSSFDPDDFETSTTTGFFGFLNVPRLLQTKIPFSYAYQMYDLLVSLDNIAAATSSGVTISLSAGTTSPIIGSSLQNIPLFSTTTVTTYLNGSTLAAIRALIIASLWISAGLFMYRSVFKTT